MPVAANGQTTNVDLLADYKGVAGASTAGLTLMRTHLSCWVTSTITLHDSFALGLKVDDSDQVVTSSAAATAVNPSSSMFLDWMMLCEFVANPVYGVYGSNVLQLDIRSKRKMQEVQEAYLLCVSPIGVAAGGLPFEFTIFARTLLAMP